MNEMPTLSAPHGPVHDEARAATAGAGGGDAAAPPTPAPGSHGRGARRRPRPVPLRRLAAVGLVAILAGGGGAAVATAFADDITAPAPGGTTGDTAARSVVLRAEALDVAGVVDAVGPAVVAIQREAGGRSGRSGAGTGVILSADGEVLTNAHVVDGASAIHVTLAGESASRTAALVGADTAADLALLRIDDAVGLPVATLGVSSSLAVGDDVVAIGNALALRGGPTVTRGIVSALDRSLETAGGTMTGLVQTDASISSGNSGGPLVNAVGEVIGINTAVAAGGGGTAAENIGFAIAVDRALPVIERLRTGATAAEPGYIGVTVADPSDGSRGAVLTTVAPGTPADGAGLRAGDLVTAVDGTVVDGAASLAAAVQARLPGAVVEVSFTRVREQHRAALTLAARASR